MADEGPRPWYAPGLYRRVLEHRRFNPPRPREEPRPPLWRRLWDSRPGWKVEAVVLLFVVVASAAFGATAIAMTRSGSASPATAPAPTVARPTPTPSCLAAPVVYATRRPCVH